MIFDNGQTKPKDAQSRSKQSTESLILLDHLLIYAISMRAEIWLKEIIGDLWQKLKRRFKIYGRQTFAWAGRQTFAFAMQFFIPRNPASPDNRNSLLHTEMQFVNACYTQKCRWTMMKWSVLFLLVSFSLRIYSEIFRICSENLRNAVCYTQNDQNVWNIMKCCLLHSEYIFDIIWLYWY